MLTLSPGVSAVRLDDEVVFLDLPRDAYTALREPERALHFDLGSNRLEILDAQLRSELLEAGLVVEAASSHATPFLVAPRAASVSMALDACAIRDHAAFVASLAATLVRHRTRSLAGLVSWARRSRPASRGELRDVERRAAVFARLMTSSLIQGDCLFRSHLLLRFLRWGSCDADWVFGVRTWPFAAHCWLEREGLVLNDDAELLRAFQPILVV